MDNKKSTILQDSDEAAYVTQVIGWASRHGRFFGKDEMSARYDGCTHRRCECGAVIEKFRTLCDTCRDLYRKLSYEKKDLVAWDGVTPVVLAYGDKFFFSEDEVLEYCEDLEIPPESLQLVLCVPSKQRYLDASEFLCDELPEDVEPPDTIIQAAEAFNRAVSAAMPLSWIEGPKRICVKSEDPAGGA